MKHDEIGVALGGCGRASVEVEALRAALSRLARIVAIGPRPADHDKLRRVVEELRTARTRAEASLRDVQEAADRALDGIEARLAEAGAPAAAIRPPPPPISMVQGGRAGVQRPKLRTS